MRSRTYHWLGCSAQWDISSEGGNLQGSTDRWLEDDEQTRKKKKNSQPERKERRMKSWQER
jgi:hypothetical protein